MPDIGKRLDNDRRQPRIVADPRIRRPGVAVVADGVDTYSRPGQSKLGQLAEALSSIQPTVGRLSDSIVERTLASERKAAKAKAIELHLKGIDFKKAVERGDIGLHDNPFFMAQFEETSGQVAGHQYGSDLAEAMANSPYLQSSLKLDDFDNFERAFRSQWIQQHIGEDPGGRFNAAFNHLVEAEVNTRRRPEFVAGLEKRVKHKASQDFTANLASFLVKDKDQPDDVLVSNIGSLRDLQLAVGRGSGDVDLDTVHALGEAALATGSYRFLELANQITGGTGAELGFDPEAAKVLRKYEKDLTERTALASKREKERVAAEKQQVRDSSRLEMLKRWSEDPYNTDVGDIVAAAGIYAEDVGKDLSSLKRTLDTASTTDEKNYQAMRLRIRMPRGNPLTNDEIWGKVVSKQLSPDQGYKLQKEMEDRRLALARLEEQRKSRSAAEVQNAELLKSRMISLWLKNINDVIPTSAEHNGASMRVMAQNEVLSSFETAIEKGEVNLFDSAGSQEWATKHVLPMIENYRFQTEGAFGSDPYIGQQPTSPQKAPSSPAGASGGSTPSVPTSAPSKSPKSDSGASGVVSYKAPSGSTIQMTKEDFEFAKANRKLPPHLVKFINETKADPREVITTLQSLGKNE